MTEQNKNQENELNFKEQLSTILNRSLTAENIDDYADSALVDLISLVEQAVSNYKRAPTLDFSNEKDLENAAFNYYGLGDVEVLLDHIASKAREIHSLSGIIGSAEQAEEVIVPPDEQSIPESKGGEFVKRKTIHRLKTLLFVLANEFGIEINDHDQLSITGGMVSPRMARENSYYLVEAKPISRSVLVCDEEGNATYIFDDQVLKELDITKKELISLKKPQLNALIEAHRSVGRRLEYSSKFVPNIIGALKDPASSPDAHLETGGKYLIPPAPEGILSRHGIAVALGIATRTILDRAILDLTDELGEVKEYKFGSRRVKGFSPEQQAVIKRYLEEQGYFNRPPEGYRNLNNLREQWEIAYDLLYRAIESLGDELGEVQEYMANSGKRPYYSPEQQQKIYNTLNNMGLIAEKAPEGYLNILGLAKEFNLEHSTISQALETIKPKIGEVSPYKFGGQIVPAFSPAQQQIIFEELDNMGLIADEAPEGVLSTYGMLKLPRFKGIGSKPLYSAIEALTGSLGEIKKYRFGRRKTIAHGFTPHQQEQIYEYLLSRGNWEDPPVGYANLSSLSKEFKLPHPIIKSAIDDLHADFGETTTYKARNGPTTYYSPEQQTLIKNYLEQKGYFKLPPEGYLPKTALAKKLGVVAPTIELAVKTLGSHLGVVDTYKFKTYVTEGFSPNQQEQIRQHLENIGFFNRPPEGYESIGGMRDKYGLAYETIRKAIEALGEALGEVKVYRFNARITEGYSPQQQEMIRQHILGNKKERQG